MNKKMKLSDKLIEVNLISEINKLINLPFLQDDAVVNTALLINYGDRLLFSKFEEIEPPQLAAVIVSYYNKKWIELGKIYGLDIDAGMGSSRYILEKSANEQKRLSDSELVNQVSAFNDDTLLTDSGNTGKNSDDLKAQNDRLLIENNISVNNAFENLQQFEKTIIIDTVLKDISNLITLSVY